MKIAVPWPVKIESQSRIKEALSLWENKDDLVICLVEPSQDDFLKDFHVELMSRNSSCIGTKLPKCFISDMLKAIIKRFPDEDWYGFGNSDVVPVGKLSMDFKDHEVIVYHRTEIYEWEDRLDVKCNEYLDHKIHTLIRDMRIQGIPDKKIAKQLNRSNIKPPNPHEEWTYIAIRDCLKSQGEVFFWGQDLFVFRKDVVGSIIKEYIDLKDPILGTGAFDPRLSKWLMINHKGIRVLNRIFHKRHESEWCSDEIEFNHNGGDIPTSERYTYYDHGYVMGVQESGYVSAIPKHLKYFIYKSNPDTFEKIFIEKFNNKKEEMKNDKANLEDN